MTEREDTPVEDGPGTDAPPGGREALLAVAEALLAARVRAAEGVMHARWSVADGAGPEGPDLNEVFPLVRAWAGRDPDLAQEIVRTAFATRKEDGFVPRWFRPDGFVPDWRAPWPLLAQAAHTVWEARPDPAFLEVVLPRLDEYLDWGYSYFDPESKGTPTWPSEAEAFVPDVWDRDLVMVDLTVFLLNEVECLLALAAEIRQGAAYYARFDDHRRRLIETLDRFLWEEATHSYRDRYANGERVARRSLSGFTPLLLRDLGPARRKALLDELLEGELFDTERGLPLWEKWPEDPAPPPMPALQQAVLVEALDRSPEEPAVARLRERLAERLADALAATGTLPADLAPEAPPSEHSSAAAACLAVQLVRPWVAAKPAVPPAALWMEEHRRSLTLTGTLLIALLVLGIGLFMHLRRATPGSSMEAIANLGKECYTAKDYKEATRLFEDFLYRSGGSGPVVHLMLGNALYRQERFAEAEQHYRVALQNEETSLHALYNLGLVLGRQKRYNEGVACFDEFHRIYATDFPDYAERARFAAGVLREQQRTAGGPRGAPTNAPAQSFLAPPAAAR